MDLYLTAVSQPALPRTRERKHDCKLDFLYCEYVFLCTVTLKCKSQGQYKTQQIRKQNKTIEIKREKDNNSQISTTKTTDTDTTTKKMAGSTYM